MKQASSFLLRDICALTIVMAAMSSWSASQTSEVHAKPITDADVKLLREDIQSMKTQIITDAMTFSEKEAADFWPLYKSTARRNIRLLKSDSRLSPTTPRTSTKWMTPRPVALPTVCLPSRMKPRRFERSTSLASRRRWVRNVRLSSTRWITVSPKW